MAFAGPGRSRPVPPPAVKRRTSAIGWENSAVDSLFQNPLGSVSGERTAKEVVCTVERLIVSLRIDASYSCLYHTISVFKFVCK